MVKQFAETVLATNYAKNLGGNRHMLFDPKISEIMYDFMIRGIATVLSIEKKKGKDVVVEVKDLKGEFKFAAMVQNVEPEEGSDEEDMWVMTYLFNEDEIPADAIIIDITDNRVNIILSTYMESKYRITFNSTNFIFSMLDEAMATVIAYLEANVTPEEEFTVEFENYDMTITMEDDVKKIKLIPSAYVNRIIKDVNFEKDVIDKTNTEVKNIEAEAA